MTYMIVYIIYMIYHYGMYIYIYIGSVDFHSGIKLSRFQKSLVFQRVIRVVVYTYHCWERPLLPASSPKSRDDFLMRSKYCNHNSPLNLGCPPVIMWLNPLTIAMIPIGPGCSTSPTEISSQTIDSAFSIQTCIFMHYFLKVGLQSQHTQEQSPKKTLLYHLRSASSAFTAWVRWQVRWRSPAPRPLSPCPHRRARRPPLGPGPHGTNQLPSTTNCKVIFSGSNNEDMWYRQGWFNLIL